MLEQLAAGKGSIVAAMQGSSGERAGDNFAGQWRGITCVCGRVWVGVVFRSSLALPPASVALPSKGDNFVKPAVN